MPVMDFLNIQVCTGKSFSKALILAATNPQYVNWKDCTLNYEFNNSMNNLSSYCWLVDSRISASEKDLPVSIPRSKTGVSMK